MTNNEIFDILGIEINNRENSAYLIPQFKELASRFEPSTIWLKDDYAVGTIVGRTDDLVAIAKDEKMFDRITSNVIFKDEDMIGYSNDIANYIKYSIKNELDPEDEGYISLSIELLDELAMHDGLVYCSYHPMGAWVVYKLVME